MNLSESCHDWGRDNKHCQRRSGGSGHPAILTNQTQLSKSRMSPYCLPRNWYWDWRPFVLSPNSEEPEFGSRWSYAWLRPGAILFLFAYRVGPVCTAILGTRVPMREKSAIGGRAWIAKAPRPLSQITSVITEPEPAIIHFKPHASPDSRASHCYAAFFAPPISVIIRRNSPGNNSLYAKNLVCKCRWSMLCFHQ